MKCFIDIFFVFDELVESGTRIEPSVRELVDGDLGEDLICEDLAFVVFEGVDDVVHQMFDRFGVEGDVAVFVLDPDLPARDGEDGVNACGFNRFSAASLLIIEFGEKALAADFFSIWSASGELRDEQDGADERRSKGERDESHRDWIFFFARHDHSDTGVGACGSTVW